MPQNAMADLAVSPSESVQSVVPLLQSAHRHSSCPVCFNLYVDPVTLGCGHVFCQSCVQRCVAMRSRCPLCNQAAPNMRRAVRLPQLSLLSNYIQQVCSRVQQQLRCTAVEERSGRDATALCLLHHQPTPCSSSSTSQPAQSSSHIFEENASEVPVDSGTTSAAAAETQQLTRWASRPERLPRFSFGARDDDDSTAPAPLSSPPSPLLLAGLSRAGWPDGNSHAMTEVVDIERHVAAHLDSLDDTPRLHSTGRGSRSCSSGSSSRVADVVRGEGGNSQPKALAKVDLGLSDKVAVREREDPDSWRQCRGSIRCKLLPPLSPPSLAAAVTRTAVGEPEEARDGAKEGVRSVKLPGTPHAAHRDGCCEFCGLNILNRKEMRSHLRRLLHSPIAECDAGELAAQTEDSLALLLGPLWRVECVYLFDAMDDDLVDGEGGSGHEGRPASLTCRGVAHHNCLAWAGLLHRFSDSSAPPSVFSLSSTLPHDTPSGPSLLPAAAAALSPTHCTVPFPNLSTPINAHGLDYIAKWQQLALLLLGRQQNSAERFLPRGPFQPSRNTCDLCCTAASPSTASSTAASPLGWVSYLGQRPCSAAARGDSTCRLHFHFPCALLAGAAACVVFGLDEPANLLPPSEGVELQPVDRSSASGGGRADRASTVEVWCGPCGAENERRRKRRRTSK